MKKRLITALIILFWLISMGLLLSRNYRGIFFGSRSASDKSHSEVSLPGKSWMGIYMKDQKAGWAMTDITKDPSEGGYRAVQDLFMEVRAMGQRKNVLMKTTAVLDSDFVLKSFQSELSSDVSLKATGAVEGSTLDIEIHTGQSEPIRQEIKLKSPPRLDFTVLLDIRSRGLKPGQEYSFDVFDPTTYGQRTMTVRVIRQEKILSRGKMVRAWLLKGDFMGGPAHFWLGPSGEALRQEAGGMVLVTETEEEAKSLDTPSVDIISEASVASNQVIPEGAAEIRVRLSGMDIIGLELDGGHQRVVDGDIVITRASVDKISLSQKSGSIDNQYLQSTPFIQSSSEEIIKKSREITKGETSLITKARLINEWTYTNVIKVPAMTIPSALEVLGSMRGDCNEHTVLYTALARSADLPARMAVGLVYRNEPPRGIEPSQISEKALKNGAFYYHAWPEVWLDEWIPVDPALGQFPADATHIRLLTGGLQKQARIGQAIGRLSIEVIEIK